MLRNMKFQEKSLKKSALFTEKKVSKKFFNAQKKHNKNLTLVRLNGN